MTSSNSRTRVLVIATDPVVGALLGMLLDPAHYEPTFPQHGERPEDALARVRPPLVILLDGAQEAARSDLFLARAQRSRAALVLFAPPGDTAATEATRASARTRGVPWVALPIDRAALTRALTEALARAATGGSWSAAGTVLGALLALAPLALVATTTG